jgi:nitrite reductase/ring-hydroxylating ferredoxin subunit
MKYLKTYRIFCLFTAFFFLLPYSCKDERDEYIPYRYVNLTVDLSINTNLTVPGNSEYYPDAGYGGLIIYCDYYFDYDPNNSLYHVWDATCTHEVSTDCIVEPDGNSFYGICPCCSTRYEFSSGYPTDEDAAATYPLKEYNVSVINNRLYISN